jgi:hypothetical protein
MDNDTVGGNRKAINSQTMNSLFTPLPDSDSGFLPSNKSLMTDDEFPTLQQLVSQTLAKRPTQTRSIPHKRQPSVTSNQSVKNKRKRLSRPNRILSDTEESSSDGDDVVDSIDSSISEEDMDENADDIDEDGNDEFVYATEGKIERIILLSKFLI